VPRQYRNHTILEPKGVSDNAQYLILIMCKLVPVLFPKVQYLRAGGGAQMVEPLPHKPLPRKPKAPSSIPNTAKTKQKQKQTNKKNPEGQYLNSNSFSPSF
jgi:hypothetical protein